MGGFLETAQQALAPNAQLKWINEAALLEAGVAPWSDLPVWLSTPDHGMHRTSIAKALAAGLVTRPLSQTLRDTATWLAGADAVVPGRPAVGLAPERESALLRGTSA